VRLAIPIDLGNNKPPRTVFFFRIPIIALSLFPSFSISSFALSLSLLSLSRSERRRQSQMKQFRRRQSRRKQPSRFLIIVVVLGFSINDFGASRATAMHIEKHQKWRLCKQKLMMNEMSAHFCYISLLLGLALSPSLFYLCSLSLSLYLSLSISPLSLVPLSLFLSSPSLPLRKQSRRRRSRRKQPSLGVVLFGCRSRFLLMVSVPQWVPPLHIEQT
jgi:hypothetical protein